MRAVNSFDVFALSVGSHTSSAKASSRTVAANTANFGVIVIAASARSTAAVGVSGASGAGCFSVT